MELSTTSKCDRSRATIWKLKSKRICIVQFVPQFPDPKRLQTECVCDLLYSWFSFRESYRTFSTGITKIWSHHRSHNRNIALGERNFLEIKNSFINQISYCPNLRANDLTCSFQKGRKKWFGRSQLKVLKKLTVHFISKFLVWCDR